MKGTMLQQGVNWQQSQAAPDDAPRAIPAARERKGRKSQQSTSSRRSSDSELADIASSTHLERAGSHSVPAGSGAGRFSQQAAVTARFPAPSLCAKSGAESRGGSASTAGRASGHCYRSTLQNESG